MANLNTATNVTAGKPAVDGALFVAPLNTTLPTNTTAALDAAFSCLGYASEDGVSNDASMETSEVKAWGGDTVLTTQTGKKDIWKVTLIEAMNTEVLSLAYGDSNVSGDLSTGITVNANSKEHGGHSYVIDMVLNGSHVKRVVIPNGVVTEVGEIKYAGTDAVGYQLTIKAIPDSSDNTHYEYIK